MNRAGIGLAICAMTLIGVAPASAQSDSEETPTPATAPLEAAQPPDAPPLEAPPPEVPTPIVATDRPFKRLFPNLLSDLRKLPSKDSAVVLGIGAAMSLAAHPLDDHVTEHASAGGTDQIFAVGGILGSGYSQAGGAIVTYAIGRIANHAATRRVGADLVRVQAVTGLLTHGVKLAARRGRPGDAPGHMPATYSFPSAHASATWASATVLWRHLGWRFGVPASLLAVYVSGSRVQQNQHFPSDVLFGAALGVATARTITVGRGRRAFHIAPSAVHGGAGVFATLVRQP